MSPAPSKAMPFGAPLDKRKKTQTDIGKKERFVLEYVACRNAAEAARRAGYAPKAARQIGYDLLTDTDVKEAVVRLAWQASRDLMVDGQMILDELASIAFAPITPGYVRASDKKAALELLGTNLKLWEGATGSRVININILELDLRTL